MSTHAPHQTHPRRQASTRRVPPLPAFLPACLLLMACWLMPPPAQADTIIYRYKDEHGVTHFTDTPDSPKFRPFLVFRGKPLRADPETIARHVNELGRKHGVDSRLVMAVIEVESGFNSKAVSRAGAQGLMQIMPQTQQELGLESPFEAKANIEAGIRYLKMLMDRFSDLSLVLAAYNAGPGAVERYKGIPPFPETQDYVRRVMANYDRRKAARK